MERYSYPSLERFEIAHRELARPHDFPVPEATNETREVSAASQVVASPVSTLCLMLEICSAYADDAGVNECAQWPPCEVAQRQLTSGRLPTGVMADRDQPHHQEAVVS